MRAIKPLPAYLHDIQSEIEGHAREFGLDIFPIIYEVLDYKTMNEVAAFGGFPTRYPHWRFGMDYEQLAKGYEFGLSKIYEMVINTNPAYAYLLEGNSLVDQKLVMAHVCGHVDFFKNNYYFSKTDRRMIDGMANHASLVRRHMNRHGIDSVEDFLDVCLSLENLIDPMSPYISRTAKPKEAEGEGDAEEIPRLRAKQYMDKYINPPEFLEAQRKKREAEKAKAKRFPAEPYRDVLLFLINHAPLERWQRDCLEIIRREAYYFAPQAMTKIMNEGWACVAADTPVFTEAGMIPMADLVAGDAGRVYDGERQQQVYDCNIIRDHETVTLETRRGLVLTGSNNHRVLLADGETWKRLDELAVGDELRVSGGGDVWPRHQIELDWTPARRVTLDEVADNAGVSVWTVLRHRAGRPTRSGAAIAVALEAYECEENLAISFGQSKRAPVTIPATVGPELGAFLGYLIGDGHISRVKRHLGLTTADEPQLEVFHDLGKSLFGASASIARDGGRWRVLFHSETVSDFLCEALGLTSGPSARDKRIPDAILRSPEPVVRAFLRALFDSLGDCDGHAGAQGVILSTASDALARQTQLLLLNYGILSRRRRQGDGCWHLHVTGASAARFAERVGFGLERKQRALDAYVADRRWFKRERWTDEVVSLERGRADVYDISVAETHRYAAGGLVNHNSYWHSKIMTERALNTAEIIDYADANAGVMATSPGRFNPYKLGVELFRHVEMRWDKGQFGKEWEECDSLAVKGNWDRRLGLGRKKIFEVRKLYNDVTFIDEFFTLEFCHDQKFYAFGFNERSGNWEIQSRELKKVKDQLLRSLTNRGQPFIYVEDGNWENRGELLLRHAHEELDLDLGQARDTMANLYRVWTRPVNLITVVENKGKLLRYDAEGFSDRPIDGP
jgi:stage V sporulation protein R